MFDQFCRCTLRNSTHHSVSLVNSFLPRAAVNRGQSQNLSLALYQAVIESYIYFYISSNKVQTRKMLYLEL